MVRCPNRSVGENASDLRTNAPDGRRMIGPVANNVASKIGRMTVTKGWHGAQYFRAKNKIPYYAFERHGVMTIGPCQQDAQIKLTIGAQGSQM